jgi:hypothetical protein
MKTKARAWSPRELALAFRRVVTSFDGLVAHRGCFYVEIAMTIALTPHGLLRGFDAL